MDEVKIFLTFHKHLSYRLIERKVEYEYCIITYYYCYITKILLSFNDTSYYLFVSLMLCLQNRMQYSII